MTNHIESLPSPSHEAAAKAFIRLLQIMDDLREKCPWDKKQTIHTLRQLSIEELYELADAITDENWKGIQEEIGDLMLHMVFYARIAREQGAFDMADALHAVSEKLIFRHPHIYADVQVNDEEDVKRNWEQLKLKEGKSSILAGVPNGLPAMIKAMRLQEKAKQVGFEWDHIDQVWEKVEEETAELKEAIQSGQQQKIEAEFGDLLFSLVNYARFLNIDAENALAITNHKFKARFQAMERLAAAESMDFTALSLAEKDALWNRIKHQSSDT